MLTTESDFQHALDREPDNSLLRLIFADWLQERDDPRSEGYRALGTLGRYAHKRTHEENYGMGNYGWFREGFVSDEPLGVHLPRDWSELLGSHIGFATRREAEDAAARAFLKIPRKRRAALLGAVTPAASHVPG